MRKCKYCGRELNGNERCTCPGALAMRRKVRMIALIAGALFLTVIIVAIVVGTSSRTSTNNPSSETTIQESSAPATEPFENENASTTADTEAESFTDATVDDTTVEETTSGNDLILVDPFDFLESPIFEGYHGIGTASVKPLNKTALIEHLIGKEPDPDNEDEFWAYTAKYIQYEGKIGEINIDITPNENLKNGDKVTVIVTVPDSLAKEIRSTARSYTVANLPELQMVDVFASIDVEYKGVSGEITAIVNFESVQSYCEILKNGYTVEPSKYNLSNGNKITVKLTDAAVQRLAKEHNIAPMNDTYTETVNGQPEYVSSPDLIPQSLIQDYSSTFLKETEENYDGYGMFTAENFKFEGAYWMTKKELNHSWREARTKLVFVVSYEEFHRGESRGTIEMYLWFANLVVNSDGTILIEDEKIQYKHGQREDISEEQREEYNITKIG